MSKGNAARRLADVIQISDRRRRAQNAAPHGRWRDAYGIAHALASPDVRRAQVTEDMQAALGWIQAGLAGDVSLETAAAEAAGRINDVCGELWKAALS